MTWALAAIAIPLVLTYGVLSDVRDQLRRIADAVEAEHAAAENDRSMTIGRRRGCA
jgi:hypothetical protein